MSYRIAGFFVAVFTLFQFSHADKAQATAIISSDASISKFENPLHGNGCSCSRCMPPSETSISDFPA